MSRSYILENNLDKDKMFAYPSESYDEKSTEVALLKLEQLSSDNVTELVDGNCYLLFVPMRLRNEAYESLGKYPLVGTLRVYLNERGIFPVKKAIKFTQSSEVFHISFDSSSWNSYLDFFDIAYEYYKVGGTSYEIGVNAYRILAIPPPTKRVALICFLSSTLAGSVICYVYVQFTFTNVLYYCVIILLVVPVIFYAVYTVVYGLFLMLAGENTGVPGLHYDYNDGSLDLDVHNGVGVIVRADDCTPSEIVPDSYHSFVDGCEMLITTDSVVVTTMQRYTANIPSSVISYNEGFISKIVPGASYNAVSSEESDHPFNSAIRSIARADIFSKIPSGARVLIIGATSIVGVNGYVYCFPNLEQSDSHRDSIKQIIQDYRAKGCDVEYTTERLENITSKFDIMIAIHVYSTPIKIQFEHAIRLGISIVYSHFLYSAALFNEQCGVLPYAQMSFEKKYYSSSNSVISFNFFSSSGETMTHDLEEFMDLITTDLLQFGGITYTRKLVKDYADCATFRYSLNKGTVQNAEHVVNSAHLNSFNIIKLPIRVEYKFPFKVVLTKEFVVPMQVFGTSCSVLESIKDAKFRTISNSMRNVSQGFKDVMPNYRNVMTGMPESDNLIQICAMLVKAEEWRKTVNHSDYTLITSEGYIKQKFFRMIFNPSLASAFESYAMVRTMSRIQNPSYKYVGRSVYKDVPYRQDMKIFTSCEPAVSLRLRNSNLCSWTKLPDSSMNFIVYNDNSHSRLSYTNIYEFFFSGKTVTCNFSSSNAIADLDKLLKLTNSELYGASFIYSPNVKPSYRILYRNSMFSVQNLLIDKDDTGKRILSSANSIVDTIYDFYYLVCNRITSVPRGGCFYKAIGDVNNSGVASPNVIRDYLSKGEVCIVRANVLYGRASAPIRLYYKDGHVDIITDGDLLYESPVADSYWLWLANGDLPPALARVHRLKEFDQKIKDISDGHNSIPVMQIIESVRYSIELEVRLLYRFNAILNVDDLLLMRAVKDFYIYDTHNLRFINAEPDELYTAAWNMRDFVEVKYDHINKIYSDGYNSRYLVMCKEVQFLRERKIVDNFMKIYMDVYQYDFSKISVTLYDGVPGCGKTFAIIRDHNNANDLVCTATKAALKDYRELGDDPRYYRTYDSVIMNGAPKCNTFYADEGLMVHAGDILLAAYLCGATRVIVYGDMKQIPFINRLPGFTAIWSKLRSNTVIPMSVTYRCCESIISLLRRHYYPCISGKDVQPGFIEHKKIVGVPEIVGSYDVIITFTQNEKDDIKKRNPSFKVFTIHEVQGKTYNHVCLVRTKTQHNDIYSSDPHIIVALSRCKISFTYLTVDMTDKLSKILLNESTERYEEPSKENQSIDAVYCEKGAITVTSHKFSLLKTLRSKGKEILDKLMSINVSYSAFVLPISTQQFAVFNNTEMMEGADIDYSLVQSAIDVLYDRPDSLKIERLKNETVFPLETDFKVHWFKVIQFMESNEVYCKPLLITPQPDRGDNSFAEVIRATRKRNLDPPNLEDPVSPDTIDTMVSRFLNAFIDDDKFQTGKSKFDYRSSCWTEDWLATRKSTKLKGLDTYDNELRNPSTYNSHVKPDFKPALDNSHNLELPAGQVVTAHHPWINATFATTFRCFTSFIKYCLKDKWKINDGLSIQELSDFWNYIQSEDGLFQYLEVDMSKFDKSQGERILLATCKLMAHFNVPNDYIDEWRKSHTVNNLVFHKVGVSLSVKYQRRSGDIATFIGNTIVAMMILAYVYDLNDQKYFGGVFGGDDSLLLVKGNEPILDYSEIIAAVFGVVIKLERYSHCPMFSSMFLIFADGRYSFIKDPIKSIIRLGRHDMFCKEHVIEYYKSFSDMMKPYLSINVRDKLAISAFERYKNKFIFPAVECVRMIVEFLGNLINNKSKFVKLFYADTFTWNRKLPPAIKERFEVVSDSISLEEMFFF